MKVKNQIWQLLLSQIPLVLLYVGILTIFWGLCWLYRIPENIVGNLFRFTWIPILIVLGYRIMTQYLVIKKLDKALEQNILPEEPKQTLLKPYWRALAKIKQQQDENQRRLEQRTAQKQDYLMLWSHEIKLPLTALQLLAENNDAVASDELQQQIQLISNQMDLLLNYERLEDFHHDLDFTWQLPQDIITPIIKDYSIFFINKNLTPRLQVGQTQILTDKKWLGFILRQVIFNALKYSNPNSTIDITWRQNQLTIADHGVGISASDLPRVFEPGFTGENGRQQQAATGMGLYMAHQVATLLGETLAIVSTENSGTAVTLTFQKEHLRLNNKL
ncbi:sensor histidine kinase [Lentilactobacillus kisonensis]|uniref:histidine kinase n=1 Tax=Lentilactobacillus kisonensis DSM 19906 = JCM 15041 TaxID=1423766 RepID=A0A0R1NL12_9LACO|nr:sensor histidine kinase [Lentilactobacillus kisonensis]KRL20943.1 ATPase histidine kinase DNA gyrase B HSP90 domain protein [Lentilactobacillus kisonensis DSM 19906 = JCM 15041]